MKVLILGSSGYVGARLYRDLKDKLEVTGTYFKNKFFPELKFVDITKYRQLSDFVYRIKPQIIIHVANNPHANWCEEHPQEATLLNQTATEYVVDAANRQGAKIIFLSLYAALNPSDEIYCRAKRVSEKLVSQTQRGYLIIRPSLVVGLSPNTGTTNFFNRLLVSVQKKKLEAFDTSWRFQPTYIGQLSEVIMHCVNNEINNTEISVAVDTVKSQYEVASDIAAKFGLKVKPLDLQLNIPTVIEDLTRLNNIHASLNTYPKLIDILAEEIKTQTR